MQQEIFVLKRDGRQEIFNKQKIEDAIRKAFIAVDNELSTYAISKSKNIAEFIESKAKLESLSVEDIQDLVENGLMSTKRKNVARAYILYRNERTIERERNSNLMKTVSEKIFAKNVQNQNANVDEYSFGGRIGEASDAMMRKYALDYCLSELAKTNHLMNRIYTHDLNHYPVGDHNCISIPFDDLLKNGFNTRQTDVRPAKSVNSALQLVAVIFQLQSLQQFGGVAATHLDHTMVPYVRMSFLKHYIVEYLKSTDEFYDLDIENMDQDEFDDWVDSNKEKYLAEMNLGVEDFTFENKNNLNRRFAQAALFNTRKEVYQAVEALYHNLKY